MKKLFRTVALAIILSVPVVLAAQTPPHPNGGNAPGSGNTPVGGGSPIDGGLTVMLLLAAGYGVKKTAFFKKNP